MKKGVMIFLILSILFLSPLVYAQEYSGLDRFTDNVKLTFSGGDNKVRLALEVREKEVDSAINNIQNQEEDKAVENLERAREKLQIVQEKVSLNTSGDVKASVDEIVNKVKGEEEISEKFDDYLLEEEKTQLTAVLTEKTYEYCKELAKEDFDLMLKEELCNPSTAQPGLEKELENLKDLQERMFVKLMLEIRSCMDDPGTCNCEDNVDVEEKVKCEEMVTLALRCEYQDDEGACNKLNSLELPEAESFVPKFLMNLFKAKEEQMLWGENHSDCVPEECWNENDKPECKQYDKFKETSADWDEYGNFIGTRNKCGKEGTTPTMKESVPECFDGDIFLEEKCGEIIVVKNEEGLINYIIKNQVDAVIEEFENKSLQNTIDVNETDGQVKAENKVREIREEMNQINNQIVNITYAAGTTAGGVAGVVVEGGEQNVVTGSGGDAGVVVEGGEQNVVTGGRSGDGGDNEVVTNDVTTDSGKVEGDGGGNEVAEADEGPGEPV